MGQLCVSRTQQAAESTTCDDPAHVAISGVAFSAWTGGNMPETEEEVYTWVHQQSSFTILFFALVLALVTWGVASALTGMMGTMTIGGLTPAALGAIAGVGYAVASTVMHSGGGLTQAQDGIFGSTGNGVFKVDLGSMSVQSQGLAQSVRNRHILSAQGYNLNGSVSLFQGDCPSYYTDAQCKAAGKNSGQMWRGDAYREVNMTLEMRAKYDDCKALGKTGAELMKCAAPNAEAWPAQ